MENEHTLFHTTLIRKWHYDF